MYIMFSGKPPFNGNNNQEIFERIKMGKFDMNIMEFDKVSPQAKDLISQMLTYDPSMRPTAEDCYNHEWFNSERKTHLGVIDKDSLKNFKEFHVNFFH